MTERTAMRLLYVGMFLVTVIAVTALSLLDASDETFALAALATVLGSSMAGVHVAEHFAPSHRRRRDHD